MRSWSATVPPLLWLAVVCAGLAVWSDDVRGIYLAVVCAAIGTVQLVVPGFADHGRSQRKDEDASERDSWLP